MSTFAMVIAAHPDDAEFGVAGTIATWTAMGREVVYVVATSGDKGSSDRSMTPERLAAIREKEQQEAADVVGVREVVFLRHPDQGLEDTPGFRKQLVRLMRQHRPERVLTSCPYRRYIWHRDHRIIGQVALDAVFPYVRDHMAYPDLLAEGFEPHKVSEILFFGSEDINYRCDITATYDLKLKALQCHHSQMREFGRERALGWVRQRCTDMAAGQDFALAEGFHRVVIPA